MSAISEKSTKKSRTIVFMCVYMCLCCECLRVYLYVFATWLQKCDQAKEAITKHNNITQLYNDMTKYSNIHWSVHLDAAVHNEARVEKRVGARRAGQGNTHARLGTATNEIITGFFKNVFHIFQLAWPTSAKNTLKKFQEKCFSIIRSTKTSDLKEKKKLI